MLRKPLGLAIPHWSVARKFEGPARSISAAGEETFFYATGQGGDIGAKVEAGIHTKTGKRPG